MSVELIGGETPLGQIASNYGWEQTSGFLESLDSGNFPELFRLGDEGISEAPDKLRTELKSLLPTVKDASIRDVLQSLETLLGRTSEDFVIVS